MTEKEAIGLLMDSYIVDFAGNTDRHRRDLEKFLISMLEEIQQYRAIGTVEECREAREKQNSKKYERGLDGDVRCSVCGTYNTDIYEHRYCSYCRQRLE